MGHSNQAMMAALLVGSLPLTGCQQELDAPGKIESSLIEPGPDAATYRLRLTATVAERLGIKTALIRKERVTPTETPLEVIPTSAVFEDPNGDYWTYTNPQPLVYVRRRIRVERTHGELAVLLDGPPAGTPVVTVGAEQLLLREIGVVQRRKAD